MLLSCIACAAIAGDVRAEGADPTTPTAPARRHETTVGIGYTGIAPFAMPLGFDKAGTPLSSASFWGYSLQITRRFLPEVECGVVVAPTSDSSDGKGSYAHALSRFTGEIRFLPFGFTTVEPWIGAEAGFVLADDQATWDPTAMSPAHAVSTTRLGHIEGLTAGTRLRVSDWIAFGARGAVSIIGFSKPSVEHEPGDTAGPYLIHPTDYRTRLWYSALFSAEITVVD